MITTRAHTSADWVCMLWDSSHLRVKFVFIRSYSLTIMQWVHHTRFDWSTCSVIYYLKRTGRWSGDIHIILGLLSGTGIGRYRRLYW